MTNSTKKGRRIIGDERTELSATISRQYAEGWSIRDIADEAGRSYGFVHRVLSEAGVELRGRGGGRKGPTYEARREYLDRIRTSAGRRGRR